MKTTATSDQVLPVNLSAKKSLSGKEPARSAVPRFDDVLSGLKGGARVAGPKAMPHRATEPYAMLPITAKQDMRRSGSGGNAGEKHEREGDSSAPAASPQPQLAMTIEDLPAIGMPILAVAENVSSQAHDRATSPAGDKRAPIAISTDERVMRASQPPLPNDRGAAPAAWVQRDATAAVIGEPRSSLELGSRSDVPPVRVAAAIDAALAVRPRAAMVSTAGFDIPQQQTELPLPLPSRDVRRSPVAGTTRVTPQTEPAPFVIDGGSPVEAREPVSVVRQEKHLPPAAAPRDARVAPSATTDTPGAGADRVGATRQELKPAESRRAADAPRVEPQVRPAILGTPAPQQVANAILQDIGRPEPQPVDGSLELPPSAVLTASGREPLRVLEVALAPADLGQVTVRMRLTGRTLELTVRAEKAETASMLERDRHLLGKILYAGGYSADDINVQTQGPATLATPAFRSVEVQPNNQAAPQFPSSGGSEGERHAPSRQHGSGGQSQQEGQGDKAVSDPRRGDALYV